MKRKLKINVSKSPQTDSLVTYRNLTIREKIMRFLFGHKEHVTVLIPGDRVDEVLISGEKEGEENGTDETEEDRTGHSQPGR